jgi:glycine cleavage system H protein
MYPQDYKYTNDHEWISVTGDMGRIGVTDFAQKQLGDIVYLELPEVGRAFKKGDVIGTIESVKAVSEIFAPVSGEVVDVNRGLAERPEAVNEDPHGSWMVVVKLTNPLETASLLDAEKYAELAQ